MVSVHGGLCPGVLCNGDPLYGNERAVRILLECILVCHILLSLHRDYPANFPVAMVPCNAGADTCAKVQFRSDGSVTGTGFEIIVKLVDAGKVCIGSKGSFTLKRESERETECFPLIFIVA